MLNEGLKQVGKKSRGSRRGRERLRNYDATESCAFTQRENVEIRGAGEQVPTHNNSSESVRVSQLIQTFEPVIHVPKLSIEG